MPLGYAPDTALKSPEFTRASASEDSPLGIPTLANVIDFSNVESKGNYASDLNGCRAYCEKSWRTAKPTCIYYTARAAI